MMPNDGWKPMTPEDFATALAKPVAEPTPEPVIAEPTPEPVIAESAPESAIAEPSVEVTAVRTRSLEERLLVAQEMGLARNILKQLAFIGPRSRTIEIQVLGYKPNPNRSYECVRSAHALSEDDIVTLCTEADSWTSHGIYFLPAKLRAGVDTRNGPPGRWVELGKGSGTTDNDVDARLILAIDFDVKRPAGISATDEELSRSVLIATRAWEFLVGALDGSDSMALLHSGNGRQIHLALESIPTDDESKGLCAAILAGLDDLFSTDLVKIDKNLFDAKRILPACGTLKKKGSPGIDERPHRRTAIVTPDAAKRLTFEDLRLLSRKIFEIANPEGRAAMHAASGKRTAPSNVSPLTPAKDSPFGRANAVPTSEVASWLNLLNSSGEIVCPGCSNTKGVSLLAHGVKCFHNSCSGKGMKDRPGFRTNIDLVMEARGATNIEATKLLGDRFGFDGTVGASSEEMRQAQGQMQTPPLPAYSGAPINSPGTAPTPTSTWRILLPEEIYASIPPIDWLVEGIIPRGTLGLLAAYGSSLKSWAELDLLDSIACGKPWLGRFNCGKGNAFLVDYESGSYEVRRRLQAIARGRREDGPVQGLSFVSFPPDFLTSAAFITEISRIAEHQDLIAIDTLAAGSPGADENDSRFAAPLNLLKGIAEKTGCSFLVLHHTRKSREGEDEREGTRGTSAIFNALDFELKFFKKDKGTFTCKQTKARRGQEVPPFLVKILEPAPDRIVVISEMVTGAQEQVEVEAELNEFKKKLLSIIQATPGLNAGSVVERAKRRKDSVLTALKEMVKSGQVFLVDGGYIAPGATREPVPEVPGNSEDGSRVPTTRRVGNRDQGSVLREEGETTQEKIARQASEIAARAESDATAMEEVTPKERQGWALLQGWETRRSGVARSVLTVWEGTAKRDVATLLAWRDEGTTLDGLEEQARDAGWMGDTKNPRRFARAKDLLPKPNVRIANLAYSEGAQQAPVSRAEPAKEPPLPESVSTPRTEVIVPPVVPEAVAAPAPEASSPPVIETAERDADVIQPLSPQDRKALMKGWTKQRKWEATSALKKREPF